MHEYIEDQLEEDSQGDGSTSIEGDTQNRKDKSAQKDQQSLEELFAAKHRCEFEAQLENDESGNEGYSQTCHPRIRTLRNALRDAGCSTRLCDRCLGMSFNEGIYDLKVVNPCPAEGGFPKDSLATNVRIC